MAEPHSRSIEDSIKLHVFSKAILSVKQLSETRAHLLRRMISAMFPALCDTTTDCKEFLLRYISDVVSKLIGRVLETLNSQTLFALGVLVGDASTIDDLAAFEELDTASEATRFTPSCRRNKLLNRLRLLGVEKQDELDREYRAKRLRDLEPVPEPPKKVLRSEALDSAPARLVVETEADIKVRALRARDVNVNTGPAKSLELRMPLKQALWRQISIQGIVHMHKLLLDQDEDQVRSVISELVAQGSAMVEHDVVYCIG